MTAFDFRQLSTLNKDIPATLLQRYLKRFHLFNQQGGKFRVAILNRCNLNCFFCHNEAMSNPRLGERSSQGTGPHKIDEILDIINAYTRLGGRQVNLTGGEPLAHPNFFQLLKGIEKRSSIIALNTNAVLARRLLRHPPIDTIDCILASLHTTDNQVFKEKLGGQSIQMVMDNIVALSRHGYKVQINYSLGPYNRDAFVDVLDFAVQHELFLKCIAFVRPDERPGFYGGEWVDPTWIDSLLRSRKAVVIDNKQSFGGHTTTWSLGDARIKVKNIAEGRLETDYCTGCPHTTTCGEGIYGLRVGVDGLWKPCLLRKEKFEPVKAGEAKMIQILAIIDSMIGDWSNARFRAGKPL